MASDLELLAAMKAAGFKGESAAQAAAVSRAEGGNAGARNYAGNNPASSVDRGWFQINSFWHPEVSDQCADNLECAALEAFRISKKGTDFGPWAATRTSRYTSELAKFKALDTGATGAGTTPITGPGSPGFSPGPGGAGHPPGVSVPGVGVLPNPIIPDPAAGVNKFLSSLAENFTRAAWTSAFVVVGAAMIVLGVALFLKKEAAPAERSAEREGGKIVPMRAAA